MAKQMVEAKKVNLEAIADFEFAEDGHTIYSKKKGDKFGVYENFAERLIKNKQAKKIESDVNFDIEGKEIKGAVTDEGDNKSE